MLASRLRFPTRKRKVTLYSDGNKQNITAAKNHFPQGTINYASRKKIRIQQKIVGVVSKIILGNPSRDQVSITQVDGFCSKLRERIACFGRKARSFAKKKICIEQRLEIFSIQHNLIEKKKGATPAMKESLIHKPLTWSMVLHERLSYLN